MKIGGRSFVVNANLFVRKYCWEKSSKWEIGLIIIHLTNSHLIAKWITNYIYLKIKI